MASIFPYMSLNQAVLVIILVYLPIVLSGDPYEITAESAKLNRWFRRMIKPLNDRKTTLDQQLVEAEGAVKVMKIRADGTGNFKTINEAITNIPDGNKNRIILDLGSENFTEKVRIDRTKPFITLYGNRKNMPTLVFDGTAAEFGTVDSASLVVEADYFSAVNVKIANSAPRPDGKRAGAQAAAMRIGGDKASFFNCKFYGFQDTFCDDRGRHFFKDCYIEGTVDFIFGGGKSIYLRTELHVIPGDPMAFITAQARDSESGDNGYSFVHCKVTGTGNFTYLGRAWKPFARVVFAYSEMSDAVKPEGWFKPPEQQNDQKSFFGEFQNAGPGATLDKRYPFVKKLTDSEAKQFISLEYLEASKWLLPPARI